MIAVCNLLMPIDIKLLAAPPSCAKARAAESTPLPTCRHFTPLGQLAFAAIAFFLC